MIINKPFEECFTLPPSAYKASTKFFFSIIVFYFLQTTVWVRKHTKAQARGTHEPAHVVKQVYSKIPLRSQLFHHYLNLSKLLFSPWARLLRCFQNWVNIQSFQQHKSYLYYQNQCLEGLSKWLGVNQT